MAKVFLDTNYFIDVIHRQPEIYSIDSLENHVVYISTLSLHIYCYSYKIKVPSKEVIGQIKKFQLIDFTQELSMKALHGPMIDFEDNVQLHSASISQADYFLTADKKLLKMKFFGEMQIVSSLQTQENS